MIINNATNLDANGDGTIDFREFLCALSVTSRGNVQEKLEWAFTIYDLDGDGFITRKEMLEIVTAIYKMVKKIQRDLMFYCSLDMKERKLCCCHKIFDVQTGLTGTDASPLDTTEAIFKAMDINEDGKLTLEEFVAGTKKDDYLVKMLYCDAKPE